MLHPSGWVRWRRHPRPLRTSAGVGNERSSSVSHRRPANAIGDVERGRLISERAQFAVSIDAELRVLCRTEAAARREFGAA
ncbi:MAG TPA: hypothetical protein VGK30_13885, partial [Candidatus Binatia bacterium]